MRKNDFGNYERQVENIILSNAFKNIPFENNNQFNSLPREKLLDSVAKNLKLRLLSATHMNLDEGSTTDENYDSFIKLFEIIDPSTWPIDEVISPWLEGERKVMKLGEILKFKIDNEFMLIRSKNIQWPDTILKAKKIASTIAISSSEAERGFSLMNLIVTKVRSSLTVDHVSNLMTINLLGKPLVDWNAVPFVIS
jgi:hypothetical protein